MIGREEAQNSQKGKVFLELGDLFPLQYNVAKPQPQMNCRKGTQENTKEGLLTADFTDRRGFLLRADATEDNGGPRIKQEAKEEIERGMWMRARSTRSPFAPGKEIFARLREWRGLQYSARIASFRQSAERTWAGWVPVETAV